MAPWWSCRLPTWNPTNLFVGAVRFDLARRGIRFARADLLEARHSLGGCRRGKKNQTLSLFVSGLKQPIEIPGGSLLGKLKKSPSPEGKGSCCGSVFDGVCGDGDVPAAVLKLQVSIAQQFLHIPNGVLHIVPGGQPRFADAIAGPLRVPF